MPTTRRTLIEALYAARASELEQAVARHVRGNHADVQDACAYAWERLLLREDIVPRDDRNTFGWLWRVAVHEGWRVVSELGTASDDDAALQADALAGHEVDHAERLTRRAEVIERLERLSERQRQWVGLHAAGYSYEEIAAMTGVSVRTLDRQLQKARRILRPK